jgi:endonuclease YncB( thermonuclease family)
VADGDTLTVITANHTKLRVRMFGTLSRDRKTILSPSLPR